MIDLVAIAGNNIEGHIKALNQTASVLPYAYRTILFTDRSPDYRIPNWGSNYLEFRKGVGKLIIKDLHKYVKSSHCILVQADGYGLNRKAWTDEFLDYDYIGAPLPLWETLCIKGNKRRRVGSGGFCLRSKRFFELSAGLDYDGSVGEDIYLCRYKHKYFESHGCRFAPVDVALRFCFEHKLEDFPDWNSSDSFGFHGLHKGKPLNVYSPIRAFLIALSKSMKRGLYA